MTTPARPRHEEIVARLRGLPGGSTTISYGRALVHEWRDDRVTGLAAEVAFFAVLSVFPALLALAGALGSLDLIVAGDVADRSKEAVLSGVTSLLGGDAGTTTGAVRELFEEESPGVLTVGAVLTVLALSRGFAAVTRALDVAYDLEERRSWLHLRLTALGLAITSILVAAVLLAAMVVGPLLGGGHLIADALGGGELFVSVWRWARLPVALLAAVAWAATVFHVAPNHRTPWRWDLPGAILTAGVWVVVSIGFRVYLQLVGGNAVLGVLGGALTLLFWLYLLAIGLLLGGELNGVIASRHRIVQVARR